MVEKKSNSSLLIELVDELPEFCQDYFIGRTNERALLTRISYARDFNYFIDWLILNHPYFCVLEKRKICPSDFANVKAVDIDKFLSVYSVGREVRSVAHIRSSVSSLYKYMIDTLQAFEYNPVAGSQKVKVPEKDFVVYLTLDEQQMLLNTIMYGTGLSKRQLACHERYMKRDLALIMLFLDTGMRVSEVHGIDNGDLDLSDCSVVATRKGGKQSKIYFSDEEAEYLREYLEEKETLIPFACGIRDPLFVTNEGHRLAVRQIQDIVPKYVNAAIPDKKGTISPHKLRSSFAMEFYKASGNDILALQTRMGHSSIQTTNVYAKAANSISQATRNWRNE